MYYWISPVEGIKGRDATLMALFLPTSLEALQGSKTPFLQLGQRSSKLIWVSAYSACRGWWCISSPQGQLWTVAFPQRLQIVFRHMVSIPLNSNKTFYREEEVTWNETKLFVFIVCTRFALLQMRALGPEMGDKRECKCEEQTRIWFILFILF